MALDVMVINAQITGRCQRCLFRWSHGDPVISRDGGKTWEHVDCPDDPEISPVRKVCPDCFLETAVLGGCDCEK